MNKEEQKIIEREHKIIFNIVRSVIHGWDPYGLLTNGAPTDEFDGEIRSIVSQIANIKSSDAATHLISRVFSDSFSKDDFKKENCGQVGTNLYLTLRKHNLLK
jgi:hypothetical protein